MAEILSPTIPDTRQLPFGKQATPHMYSAVYRDGSWQEAGLVPFADLQLSPFSLCLHYGQTVFEGMKAFRMDDGRINIFRPGKHYQRFVKSLERMCMPLVPEALFMQALEVYVNEERDWVPSDSDGSLYLRPFMIATEPRMGVKVSEEYLFLVVGTPAYQYYSEPLRVKVETHYARAAQGGTGFAKCGGNYGAAFLPAQEARAKGFDQVIWTDSSTHEYIEESGTMNLMFVADGLLLTPPLSGTILDGVTRDSLLQLAKDKGLPMEVRPVRWREIEELLAAGKRVEAFGAGTAAVIAPIRELTFDDERAYPTYTGEDATMYHLRDALYAVRCGTTADTHHWNHIV